MARFVHTAGEGKLSWRKKAMALRWRSSGSPRRASHPTLSDLCSALTQCGMGSQGASCDHQSSPRWGSATTPTSTPQSRIFLATEPVDCCGVPTLRAHGLPTVDHPWHGYTPSHCTSAHRHDHEAPRGSVMLQGPCAPTPCRRSETPRAINLLQYKKGTDGRERSPSFFCLPQTDRGNPA